LWGIIIATGLNGVFGAIYVADILKFQIAGVEAIGEHGLSIRYNVFFVILIAAWMFQGSPIKRVIMPFFLPFVLLSYAANNRRASFIAMAIALLIFAFVLYRFDRKRFWLIVPFCALFSMAYIGVFWNSSGAIGAPAKAIRSVIGQPDPRDASSNVYRLQENINILFTIKSSPIFGVGFGQKFFILVPMADISFFEWWQYITHNSILWIWLKTGVGGFISMLVMIGLSIAAGARTLWRMPNNDMAVAALMALTYIVMHFVYAYVDMSWDAPNMVMVATSIGLIICLIPIVSQESPPPSKRWPWQRDPEPTPRLRPLTP
jgi:hypothetical protein